MLSFDEYRKVLSNSNYQSISLFKNLGNHTEGVFERVAIIDSDVQEEISQQNSDLKRAEIYAKQGLWEESLSLVNLLQQSQPQIWQQLLTSVNLEKYSSKDIKNIQKIQKLYDT